MRARSLHLALLVTALAAAPAAGTAQRHAPVVTRPGIVWLPWGQAHVLVVADTLDGVMLWAGTTLRAARRYERMSAVTRLAPDAVAAWEERATAVLLAMGPAPDPKAILLAELPTLDGGTVALGRQQRKGEWSREHLLYLQGADAEPIIIKGTAADAQAFAAALTHAATMSRVAARTGAAAAHAPCAVETRGDTTCVDPAWVQGNPHPRFPSASVLRGGTGEVWARFEIDSTGVVDTATVEILMAEHPKLEEAVRAVLPDWRFLPARRAGIPVRARYYRRYVVASRSPR